MIGNLHAQVTALLDGTHCPKHGVEWEACCLAEVSIEIHNKIITLLTTVRKEVRETAWQSIETAPKDGTRILLVHGSYIWLDTWWKGDGTNSDWSSIVAWRQATGKTPDAPTHWMPLPQPPIEAAANTEEGAGDG